MLNNVFARPLSSGHDRPFLVGDGKVSSLTSSGSTEKVSRLNRSSAPGDWTFTIDLSGEREIVSWLRGVYAGGESIDLWAAHEAGVTMLAEDCVLSSYSVPDQDTPAVKTRFAQSAAVSAARVLFFGDKFASSSLDARDFVTEAPGCIADVCSGGGFSYIALVVSPSGAADALRIVTSRNGIHWSSSQIYGTFTRPSDLAAYKIAVLGESVYFVAAGKVYSIDLSSLIPGVTVRPMYITPPGISYGTLIGFGSNREHVFAAFADGSYWRIFSRSNVQVTETYSSGLTCAALADDGMIVMAGGTNMVASLPSGAAMYGAVAVDVFAVIPVGRNAILSITRPGAIALSEDYGITWTQMSRFPGAVCAVRQISRNVLFASVGVDCGAAPFLSIDGGYSWQMVDVDGACCDVFGAALIDELVVLCGQVTASPAARTPNGFAGVAPTSANFMAHVLA